MNALFRVAANMTTLSNPRAGSERKRTLRVRKEKLEAKKSSKSKSRPNCLRKSRSSPTIKRRGKQRQSKKLINISNTTTHLKRRNPRVTSVYESVKMRKRQETSYSKFFDSDSSNQGDWDSSSSEDEPKPIRRRTRRNTIINSKPQQIQAPSAPSAIYPCDMCDFSSTCPSTLTHHRIQDHANEIGEMTTACSSSASSTGGSAADQDPNYFESIVESVGSEPLTKAIRDPHSSGVLRVVKGASFKICPHCTQEFDSLYDYRLHIKSHEKRVFRCNKCSYVSRFQVGLNMHMKRHGEDDWKISPSVLEVLTVWSAPAALPASDYSKSQHSTKIGFEADVFVDQKYQNIITIFPPDSAQAASPSPTMANKQQLHLLPPEPSSPTFMCPLCQEKFQREFLLDNHMRSHSYREKEKKLLCSASSCQHPLTGKHELDEKIPIQKVSAAFQSSPKLQLADIFLPTNTIKVEPLEEDPNPSLDKVDPDLSLNNFQLLPLTPNLKNYICYLCKYVCFEDSELKTHIASHVVHSIAFDCSQCNFSSSNALDVAQHSDNCHSDITVEPNVPAYAIRPNPKRPDQVEQSDVSGKSKEKYLNILPRNQQTVPLPSSFQATVNNNGNCINVKAGHGRPKSKLSCGYCSKKFTTKSNLIIHERIHTGERPFKCKRCSYTATSRGNLKLHMPTHMGRIFFCNYCDYRASNEPTIRNHRKRLHPETHAQADKSSSRPVVPTTAGPSKKRSNLSGKVRRVVWEDQVTGSSPSGPSPSEEEKDDVAPSEDYCDSDWCQESDNASETDGEGMMRKVFKCELCPRQFGFLSHLRSHRRSHTEERPFSCPHCDFTTAYTQCLASHLTCHTENRPYKCKFCTYSSSVSSVVVTHLKKDHGKIVEAYRHSKGSLNKLVCKKR